MIFVIQVLAANGRAASKAGQLKEAAIPSAISRRLQDNGVTPRIYSLSVEGLTDEKVLNEVLQNAKVSDACAVVLDSSCSHLVSMFDTTLIVETVSKPLEAPHLKNTLAQAYTSLTKKFLMIKDYFMNRAQKKFLILPRKNFSCHYLPVVFTVATPHVQASKVREILDSTIAKLRCRCSPKKKSDRPEVFIIDDEKKYFQLGYEKHSQAAEAEPPHSPECRLAKYFRLGMRLYHFEHFNVSNEGNLLGGTFEDCHGDTVIEPPRTHFNMFPSGFY